MTGWRSGVLTIAGTLLLLLAIRIDGFPTAFTDTDDYYSQGVELWQTAKVELLGQAAEPDTRSAADKLQAATDAELARTQMAARSTSYSVFLYGLESAGTLWLVAAVQAACAAWVLLLTLRCATPRATPAGYLLLMAGLAAGSTLPLFAGFAMPDVLAGVAVLGIALVALYWTALTRIERAGTATLLTFCFVVHTSHLLLGVVLVPVAALLLRWLRVPLRAVAVRGAVVIGALVAASALNAGYGHYVLAQTGQPLRHQPFVMARVLADGPGRVYLRRTCAGGSGLALCRFKNLPLDDSEDILWSDLPNRGVFLMADYATRVRLEDEELGFVLGTIADDPVGQIRVSAQNWARQLTMVGVDDVVRDPRYYLTDDYWSKTYLPDMIMAVAHCGRRGDACPLRLTPRALTVDSGLNGRSPPAPVSARAYGAVVIAALALTGALMWRVRREPVRPLLALAALILAAVVLNAGVTGVISGPFARYQARLIWLVPALCGVVLMAARMPMLGKRRETA